MSQITGVDPLPLSVPTTFRTTAGDAIPALNILTLTNGANITLSGAGSAITAALSGTTNHAIQLGNVGGSLTSLALGVNGQTVMGVTGAIPSWTSSPQFGGSVTALNDITSTAGDIVSIGGSLISRDATNTATGPDLLFQKVRVAAIITSGDELGLARFTGYDGVGYITGAKIASTNSGTVGVNRVAGDLKFYTHPDSAIALPSEPLLRMTINPNGSLVLSDAYNTAGTPSGTAKVSLVDSNGLLYGLAGTAGQILQGGNAPSFSTATYPSTVAIGDVLVASAANVIGVVTGGTTAGHVLTANGAGSAPTFQAITPYFTWNQVAANAVTPAVINNGYILQNAGLTTVTLPATAAYGTTIEIIGEGAGGWTIVHPVAGHYIQYGNAATTANTGSLASSNRYDTVKIVCRVDDTVWHVTSVTGILNVL